eukprot:2561017-Pyramimonas_sp.AAC.1
MAGYLGGSVSPARGPSSRSHNPGKKKSNVPQWTGATEFGKIAALLCQYFPPPRQITPLPIPPPLARKN